MDGAFYVGSSQRHAAIDGDFCWYLVRLKPGGFELARRNLKRQGYETFMPMQRAVHRRGSRMHQSKRPLFLGYLFVKVAVLHPGWRAINATRGVSRLVSLSGQFPTPVPRTVLETLMARTNKEGIFEAFSGLAQGDSVRLTSGPFASSVATIEKFSDGDRVLVLMEIMGRGARTNVALGDLERA